MRVPTWPSVSGSDLAATTRLLGRVPNGIFVVVARRGAPDGEPAVIACWPIIGLDKPMPTLFWLLDPILNRQVAQLESFGMISRARAEVPPEKLERAHQRYRFARDSLIPELYQGPRPQGGIGGTRSGVKCIHAHLAFHLVAGDDPVATWLIESGSLQLDLANFYFEEFPLGLEVESVQQ